MILYALGIITGLLIAKLREPPKPKLTAEEKAERIVDKAMADWRAWRKTLGYT